MDQMIPAHTLRELATRWRLWTAVENNELFAEELEELIPKYSIADLVPKLTREDLIDRIVVSKVNVDQRIQIIELDEDNGVVEGWNITTKEIVTMPLQHLELQDDDPFAEEGKLALE